MNGFRQGILRIPADIAQNDIPTGETNHGEIEVCQAGGFISKHASDAIYTYTSDSEDRVVRVPFGTGVMAELTQERTEDHSQIRATYRTRETKLIRHEELAVK